MTRGADCHSSSPSFSPLVSSFLPYLFPFPPQIQLEVLGSAVCSPSGIWGRVPAEIESDAFKMKNVASCDNNLRDIHEEHID